MHGTVLSICLLSWAALPAQARASPRLTLVGVPLLGGTECAELGGRAERAGKGSNGSRVGWGRRQLKVLARV